MEASNLVETAQGEHDVTVVDRWKKIMALFEEQPLGISLELAQVVEAFVEGLLLLLWGCCPKVHLLCLFSFVANPLEMNK